jgi:hypothetical protein
MLKADSHGPDWRSSQVGTGVEMAAAQAGQIRNPNSEIRRKSEFRNPKEEKPATLTRFELR